MLRRLALTSFLCLAACAPALTEGRYSCADGACPPGWHCHSDEMCRSTPERDSGGPARPDAARPPRTALAPCARSADCDSGQCYRGGPREWPIGYCSVACASDGECSGLGEGASCDDIFEHRCHLRCTEVAPDCPGDYQCVAIFRDGDHPALGECFPLEAPIRASGDPCADDSSCPDADFNCIERRCHRPCTVGRSLPCAPGERCVASPANGGLCTPET